MKLLICGGRTFTNYSQLSDAMNRLPFKPSIIIEGGARGADRLGRTWAINNGVHYATVPALWDSFGDGAGPRRNSMMLLLKPDYCLALPGGTGTRDMVSKCKEAGVVTWQPLG